MTGARALMPARAMASGGLPATPIAPLVIWFAASP
jgi:hypothetical protein